MYGALPSNRSAYSTTASQPRCLYVRHHTADNLLNIAARTSRTGFHFADDLLALPVPSAVTIFKNIMLPPFQ